MVYLKSSSILETPEQKDVIREIPDTGTPGTDAAYQPAPKSTVATKVGDWWASRTPQQRRNTKIAAGATGLLLLGAGVGTAIYLGTRDGTTGDDLTTPPGTTPGTDDPTTVPLPPDGTVPAYVLHSLQFQGNNGVISKAGGGWVLSAGDPQNILLEIAQKATDGKATPPQTLEFTKLDANGDKVISYGELEAAGFADGIYHAGVKMKAGETGQLLSDADQAKYLEKSQFDFMLDGNGPAGKLIAASPGSPVGIYKTKEGTLQIYTNAKELDTEFTISDEIAGVLSAKLTALYGEKVISSNEETYASTTTDGIVHGDASQVLKGKVVMDQEGTYKLILTQSDFGQNAAELTIDVINDQTVPLGEFLIADKPVDPTTWYGEAQPLTFKMDGTGSPIQKLVAKVNGGQEINLLEEKYMPGRTTPSGELADNYIPELGLTVFKDADGTVQFFFDKDGEYKFQGELLDAAGNKLPFEKTYRLNTDGPDLGKVSLTDGALSIGLYDVSGIDKFHVEIYKNGKFLDGSGTNPISGNHMKEATYLKDLKSYGLQSTDSVVVVVKAADSQGKWSTSELYLDPSHFGQAYTPPKTAYDNQAPGPGDSYNNGQYQQNQPPTQSDQEASGWD